MTVETTHRATAELGPGVVDNRLLWSSASGVTSADPHSFGGCLRKWHFDQVGGFKQESTKAQATGTVLHGEIEGYQLRGEQLTSPLAMSGAIFIDKPGPGIYIERPLALALSPPAVGIKSTWLFARGKYGPVPFAGHIDLQNLRGEYLNEDGKLCKDEPKTLETKDWKSTASFDFAKTATELAGNIQLVTYAQAGFKMEPDFELARLTHVYFLTRGRPQSKLVTIRVDRRHVESRWEYAESVVRTMDDAARETNADKITPNLKACDAYRGCPHRERCTAYRSNSLDNLYAKAAADDFQLPGDTAMGLLQSNPQIMNTASAATQPDMRAQLAAEEQQLRAQQQQIAPVAAPSANVLDAWKRITAHGRGTPALGMNAARAYAAANGYDLGAHAGYAGAGGLAGVTIHETAHIFQFADDLDRQAGIAPPVTPPPQAAYAPPPMPTATPTPSGILPPGAPASRPELAVEHTPAPTPSEPEAPKKKAGRPKAQSTPPDPALPAAQAAPPQIPAASAPQGAPSGGVLTSQARTGVFVDCLPLGLDFKLLGSYIDEVNAELSRRYCVDDAGQPTVQDVRCAPPKSILGFGGWRGVVRDCVITHPPAPGVYALDTRGNELAEVVADALRTVCGRAGALYVRSTR